MRSSPRSPDRWRAGKCAVAVALALLVVVPGCERTREPLRVGLVVWPPFELGYLAEELGHYEDASIRFVNYLSPAEVARAYRNGLIDVAAGTTSNALTFHAAGQDQRAILVIDQSMGGDALVVRGDADEPEQLEGKRIGVEKSALEVYVLHRALAHLGVAEEDVTIVSVDVADHEAAFRRGDVDAVVTYEPIRSKLLADGAVEVFSSRDIPGEIVDVLGTRASTVEERGEQLQVLVDGWLEAVDHLREHPDESIAVMARRESMSNEAFARMLEGVEIPAREGNVALLGGDEPALLEPTRRLADRMVELGQLPEVPPVRPMFDDRFVRGSE